METRSLRRRIGAAAAVAAAALACSSPTVSRAFVGHPSLRLAETKPVAPEAIQIFPADGPQPSGAWVERIAWITATYDAAGDRPEALRLLLEQASLHHANVLLDLSEMCDRRERTPWLVAMWAPPPMPQRDVAVEHPAPLEFANETAAVAGALALVRATVLAIDSSGPPREHGTIRACAARIFEPESAGSSERDAR